MRWNVPNMDLSAHELWLEPLGTAHAAELDLTLADQDSGQQGTVRYEIEWPGLTAEEKAEGCVLPCVAYPVSDVVLQGSAI